MGALKPKVLARAAVASFVIISAFIGLDEQTLGVNRPEIGTIAFVRDGDVWIATGSGTHQERLIADASEPAWSPAGNKLAFVRRGEIWSFSLQTRSERQLTSTGGRASDPGWLDSANVVYSLQLEFVLCPTDEVAPLVRLNRGSKNRRETLRAIWTVDTDSERMHELIGPMSNGLIGDYSAPAVHPATGKLAFVLDGDIWAGEFGPRGLEARRLAACADLAMGSHRAGPVVGSRRAVWTPGGVWVVFDLVDLESGRRGELWAVDSVTGKRVQITHRAQFDLPPAAAPSVSPQGNLIAYEAGGDVWLCGMDGSDSRRFIENGSQPAWSPRPGRPAALPPGFLLPRGRESEPIVLPGG
jgi:hypothetical protein